MRASLAPFLAVTALLLLAAAPVEAGSEIDGVADKLVYDFCPRFLSEEFPLTGNSELAKLGFSEKIESRQHPQFGLMQVVSAERSDGGLAFGGASGTICSVVISGPNRAAALAALRTGIPDEFKPASLPIPAVAGVTIQTLKAPVDDQFIYLQLIEAGGPTPAVIAQLFVMEE